MKEITLLNIAKNLADDFKQSKTPSDVYTNLMQLAKSQPEYFIHYLGPKNMVKLTIMIWSLIKTGGFELANKIVNNLNFVTLMYSEGTHPEVECDYCNGSGYESCGDCSGGGKVNCDNCDGSGEETCSVCDGKGTAEDDEGNSIECDNCNGNGEEECSDCGGQGEYECGECGGSGEIRCNECDGAGEVEDTDQYIYTVVYLITWDNHLNYLIQNQTDKEKPFMDTIDLSEFNKDYIMTYQTDDNSASINVEDDMYYLMDTSDDPEIGFTHNNRIIWDYDDDLIKHL